MFGVLKKLAGVSIVFTVVNAVCTIITYMMAIPYFSTDISLIYVFVGMTATTTIVSLVLSIALWILHGDLEAHNDTNAEDVDALKKRLTEVENTLKYKN